MIAIRHNKYRLGWAGKAQQCKMREQSITILNLWEYVCKNFMD